MNNNRLGKYFNSSPDGLEKVTGFGDDKPPIDMAELGKACVENVKGKALTQEQRDKASAIFDRFIGGVFKDVVTICAVKGLHSKQLVEDTVSIVMSIIAKLVTTGKLNMPEGGPANDKK